MSESDQLIAALKRELKRQGKTYRDVATGLRLSEPSVKRLFASGRFTLERLVEVCGLLGFTLAELAKESETKQARLASLSEKQERELVSDPRLLLVAVLALNHWTLDDIVAYYKLSLPDGIKYLLRLDHMSIISLLPGNRIRLNVSRDFDWLPNGPIRQYFKKRGLDDFLQGDFSDDFETMNFIHGMFTEQALAEIHDELRRLRQRFAEKHEESLSAPLSKRYGFGLLLAMRGWEPEDFVKLRKKL